jgi:single-stranded DNA-binding protein
LAFWIKDAFATVWEYEDKGKFTSVRISTSRKDKQDNFVNSNWFATFVGQAHEKIEGLADRSRIKILSGQVTNEARQQDDGTKKSFTNVVVFDFEELESSGGGSSKKNTAPKKNETKKSAQQKPKKKEQEYDSSEIDDEELPFN